LTTATLDAILRAVDVDVDHVDLAEVWSESQEYQGNPDVVLLSTTFICNRSSLRRAISWIASRTDAPLVLGGQYSNIKYAEILRDHPRVAAIIRGDGEHSLPALMAQFAGGRGPDFAAVPNAVYLDDDTLRIAPLTYVDLADLPGPRFTGQLPIVPYESMRGCPYSCKFCLGLS
jgi:radical SAM superfamily enzyme YgiQ (UPF0313 family)